MTTFIPRSKQFRLWQQRYLDVDIHIILSPRRPFVPPRMCVFVHPSFLFLPEFLDPHLPSLHSTPATLSPLSGVVHGRHDICRKFYTAKIFNTKHLKRAQITALLDLRKNSESAFQCLRQGPKLGT